MTNLLCHCVYWREDSIGRNERIYWFNYSCVPDWPIISDAYVPDMWVGESIGILPALTPLVTIILVLCQPCWDLLWTCWLMGVTQPLFHCWLLVCIVNYCVSSESMTLPILLLLYWLTFLSNYCDWCIVCDWMTPIWPVKLLGIMCYCWWWLIIVFIIVLFLGQGPFLHILVTLLSPIYYC